MPDYFIMCSASAVPVGTAIRGTAVIIHFNQRI